jgi:hypothetical protein
VNTWGQPSPAVRSGKTRQRSSNRNHTGTTRCHPGAKRRIYAFCQQRKPAERNVARSLREMAAGQPRRNPTADDQRPRGFCQLRVGLGLSVRSGKVRSTAISGQRRETTRSFARQFNRLRGGSVQATAHLQGPIVRKKHGGPAPAPSGWDRIRAKWVMTLTMALPRSSWWTRICGS